MKELLTTDPSKCYQNPKGGTDGILQHEWFFPPDFSEREGLFKELGVTADRLPANPDLKSILVYHLAGGSNMGSSFGDGQKVATAKGDELGGQASGGEGKTGRTTVTAADVACIGGMIHDTRAEETNNGRLDMFSVTGIIAAGLRSGGHSMNQLGS